MRVQKSAYAHMYEWATLEVSEVLPQHAECCQTVCCPLLSFTSLSPSLPLSLYPHFLHPTISTALHVTSGKDLSMRKYQILSVSFLSLSISYSLSLSLSPSLSFSLSFPPILHLYETGTKGSTSQIRQTRIPSGCAKWRDFFQFAMR